MLNKCTCKRSEIERYQHRLSRPLLDRIDLKVMVSAHDQGDGDDLRYASTTVRRQIEAARVIQQERYAVVANVESNADIADRAMFLRLNPELSTRASNYFDEIARQLDSKRVEVKLLLVARTIADLAGASGIRVQDVREATDLMGLRDPYFRPM